MIKRERRKGKQKKNQEENAHESRAQAGTLLCTAGRPVTGSKPYCAAMPLDIERRTRDAWEPRDDQPNWFVAIFCATVDHQHARLSPCRQRDKRWVYVDFISILTHKKSHPEGKKWRTKIRFHSSNKRLTYSFPKSVSGNQGIKQSRMEKIVCTSFRGKLCGII